jgi:ribosome-interacting GTPase 1
MLLDTTHLCICIVYACRHALVWGTSVKYSPQKVGKDHVLNDEDVVQVVKTI